MSQHSPILRHRSRIWAGMFGLAAVLTLVLSACGASSSGKTGVSSSSKVTCPSASTVASWHLVNSGHLTVASDTTYPPAEYLDQNNKPVGYDMDLAREFGRRLCLTTTIVSATFDDIIPSLTGPTLGQQKYDMSISSFSVTPERQQKVDMIPYFQAGESIVIPASSSLHVSSIGDLCGKTVAVETGTIEEGDIDGANKTGPCKSNPIKKKAFQKQDDVINQVVNGSVDAGYQDSPVSDYYVKQTNGKVKGGGFTVAPSPEGLVMRKDNPALKQAITNALNAMRQDGTYTNILKYWGAQDGAYPKS